jgi:adenylate cyclase
MIPAPVPDLNRLLMDNLALVVGVMGAAIIVLAIVAVLQSRRLRRTADAYRALVSDNKGVSLQQLLNSHLGKVVEIGARMEELTKLHESLEARSRGSLQHIGMVRFNPFEDTGSDQSFAIALLDDRRDGIVLSSLHGRGQTRVFAKPVEGGESKHTLSDEEAHAIRIAVDGARSATRVG